MGKFMKRIMVGITAAAMLLTTVLTWLPPLDVLAAESTVAHLVSGSSNGNGHFGSANPEAFVMSPEKYTDEEFSFNLIIGSETAETRFRFVNKYMDDDNWSFIAYDGATGWLFQYENDGAGTWSNISGLPLIGKDDRVSISGSYSEDGFDLTVENNSTGETGTITIANVDFLALADKPGQIGFGAATFSTQYTDIYFSDVIVGGAAYTSYNDWSIYNDAVVGTWNPDAVLEEGGGTEPDPEPSTEGKKWITVQGGANNGGGHSYGDASVRAPAFLMDNDRTMPVDGTISLTFRPVTSDNFGIFYTYADDNNYFYVGYDPSSKWYYQYELNNSGTYASISGLPAPVTGESMSIEISLSRENLSVTVNGTKASVSVQNLYTLATSLNGTGKFGVKTNNATKVEFSDLTVDGVYCMDDEWVWCAERSGQITETYYTAVEDVTGNVTDETTGDPIEGATVRFGTNSAITDESGNYLIENLEAGSYNLAVTKAGYQAYEASVTVIQDGDNVFNVALQQKEELNLADYDSISSDYMTVYIGKDFPLVARYVLNDGSGNMFRAQENELNEIEINGTAVVPENIQTTSLSTSAKSYTMTLKDEENSIDLELTVEISVDDNDLTWEVTSLKKNDGCADIETIEIPQLNLLAVDAVETDAVFDGAKASTSTTAIGDVKITWNDGFSPSTSDGYLYAFLTNGTLSGGVWSNSEVEGDERIVMNSGADTMSLASAVWYYECGDANGQGSSYDYPVSDLPCAKVCITGDLNEDGDLDWNDGALAFRDIMNVADGAEDIKDLVNYRIVMNFASMAANPYLETADNIKKVYLATDGLGQAVMLKGYGNEGHDSANSEYADIAERQGGLEDFQNLIKIAHDYGAEIGIHINAQEAYPEAKSFNESMIFASSFGWGWLDQSFVINKLWDLGTQARYKRLVQLYDRINGTNFYSGDWEKGEYVLDSQGVLNATMDEIAADASTREDNMDFIYLDVWYQDAWETRQVAKEINSLGWRFSTEFGYEGEYDSTWSHWATDAAYGGSTLKGYNSEIIRFIRNDQRDTHILNYPAYGGTADNPLLGGYRLYGFEGWSGDNDFDRYITETFTENLPTRFLQHYYVTDWENYEEGESPTANHEKQITLKNDDGDTVVVTRNETQRSDSYIERTVTLNGTKVLDDVTYLLPWDDEDGEEKLYHWNLDGGETTWELLDGWDGLASVVVYELSDQGRINEQEVPVINGTVTLNAKAATAYVVAKGESVKEITDYGEYNYVTDPGFNGYADGAELDSADWSGDIANGSVYVERQSTGDQWLKFDSPVTDTAVTTQITGLTAGTDYVAEVYVANESDEKASIEVNTGSRTVSNYTVRSILMNYVQGDEKHGTNMQRMQISFTAESDTAELTLSREAGSGITYMDDIRIVEQSVNNFDEDGNFTQDFESVVQGLYPFVLSSGQGVTDPCTHLSQLNAPYTQAGWNGRVIDDVIAGEWSLKHHSANTGIIYQTIPQNFRFEAGKVYTVEFDYQAGPAAYAMVVGDGTTYYLPTEYLAATQNGETEHVTMTVTGSGSGQTWIGLYENGSRAGSGSMGQTDFVLDNLTITCDETAVAVTIDTTDLYLGETAQIYGSNMDQVTFESSDENVVTIDPETLKVSAVGAGTAVITAALPDGTVQTFEMTVTDTVVTDVPEDELGSFSATANTEEAVNEPSRGGTAMHAVDGDSYTFWSSQWGGTVFVVSEDNPAVLTVDLGKVTSIGGFRIQQREDTNNGIIYEFNYKILDESGTELASGAVSATDSERTGGSWITTVLDENVDARYIEISVTESQNGFAAIAEVELIRVEKVAEEATLEDVTIEEGGVYTIVPGHPEGTILKGLVWNSSDESVAVVDNYGNVTAVKEGSAVISVSNAAGLYAECTVTVTAAEEPADTEAPTQPGGLKVTGTTENSITIEWTASEDNVRVAGYEVFVDGESIGTVTETGALIENLAADTEYEIRVRAFDEAGNYSGAAVISVKTAAESTTEEPGDEPGGTTGDPSGSQGGSGSGNDNGSSAGKPVLRPAATGDTAPVAAVAAVIVLAAVCIAAAAGMKISRRRKRK